MAVTGAQCIAACALTPGTVADSLWQPPTTSPAVITLEHPSGSLDVLVTFSFDEGFKFQAAGLMRTARKLADGHVYVPTSVWAG
jgi:4-oxalomesaconate tautomerase